MSEIIKEEPSSPNNNEDTPENNKGSFDSDEGKQAVEEEFVLDHIHDDDSVDNVLAEANSLPSPARKLQEQEMEEGKEATIALPTEVTTTKKKKSKSDNTKMAETQPSTRKPDPPAYKLQDTFSKSIVMDAPGTLEPSSTEVTEQEEEEPANTSVEIPFILKFFLVSIAILVVVVLAMQIAIGIKVLEDSSDDAGISASAIPTSTKDTEQPSITITPTTRAPTTPNPSLPSKPTSQPSSAIPPEATPQPSSIPPTYNPDGCVTLPENSRQALEDVLVEADGRNILLCSTYIVFDQEIKLDRGMWLGCDGECIFDGNKRTRLFSFGSADSPLTDEAGGTFFDNIIFQNGSTDGQGGAMAFFGAPRVAFVDCSFLDNETNLGSWNGGAIHIEDGDFRIGSCVFARNFAGGGGAINTVNSRGSISDSYFINNTVSGYWEGNAIALSTSEDDSNSLKDFYCVGENIFVGNTGGSAGRFFEPDILVGDGMTYEGCNPEWTGTTYEPTVTLLGPENHRYGDSVTLSDDGSIMAVVAYNVSLGVKTELGYIQVFKFENDNYAQLGGNIEVPLNSSGERISLSSSSDGYSIAVGTGYNDNSLGMTQAGQVRVFTFIHIVSTDGEWIQVGPTLDSLLSCQLFGYSVSLSGDGTTVVIGAPYVGDRPPCNEMNSGGVVEVYSLVGNQLDGQWIQLGQSIVGRDGDRLGTDVSISKDGRRISARTSRWDDDGATSSALVFELGIRSSWEQLGFEIMAEISEFLSRGMTLSGDGKRIAIASKYMANGVAYVNVWEWFDDSGTWVQVGSTIEDSDKCCSYFTFENSVAFSDDGGTLVFGNQGHGRPGEDGDEFRGIVRVFKLRNGSWVQIGNSIEGNRALSEGEIWFGFSVAISSDGMRIASGAPSGSYVQVYDLEGE